jgi:hypothetical protein
VLIEVLFLNRLSLLPTREAMAKANSGELIFPQFPNGKSFSVWRVCYFTLPATEILFLHIYLLQICRQAQWF